MTDSAGAADAAYEEMAAGVQFQLNQLKVWWQTLKLDIGEDLTESLKDLLYWLEENRGAIESATKAIFDGVIGGLEWIQRNAGAIKAALITIAVGFGAIRFAVDPLSASIGLLTGGIALFVLGVESSSEAMLNASVVAAIWGKELDTTAEKTSELDLALAALRLSVNTIPGLMIDAETSIDNYIAAVIKAAGELWEVGQLSAETFHEIKDGLETISTEMEDVPVEERMARAQVAITNLLNALAENDKAVARLRDAWLGLSGAVGVAGKEISDAASESGTVIAEALEDERDAIVDTTSEWYIHAADVIEANAKIAVAVREANEEIQAGYLQTWETIKSSAASTLSSMVIEFFSYGKRREDAEKAHQQKLQDIIAGANDKLADIDLSDQRRREDAQIAFNRKREEIDEWYQEQKTLGKAHTYEDLIKLDKEYSKRMVDAQEDYTRTLEDLDTAYTRAVEDNADDREQAKKDEVKAYQDAQLSIGQVLANMVKDLLWYLSEQLLLKSAAELVEAIAKTILLDPSAALHYGASFKYATGAAALGIGAMSVPGYAEGGVVPGPIGAPQIAVVHGGEPIGAAGFAEVLDYERLGDAVAAGMGDVMEEFMGDGRPIIVQLPDGTKLAQTLYPALQVESARRGGDGW